VLSPLNMRPVATRPSPHFPPASSPPYVASLCNHPPHATASADGAPHRATPLLPRAQILYRCATSLGTKAIPALRTTARQALASTPSSILVASQVGDDTLGSRPPDLAGR
jgi:hypothetical protein